MGFEEQISEAGRVITSLWMPSLTQEVAEVGIITSLPAGEAAIVSSVDGSVLWCGGRILDLSWAVAFMVAAKSFGASVQSSPGNGTLGS